MNNTEEWLDVTGYEGKYQVSNFGRVKSLSRMVNCEIGQRRIPERILKQSAEGSGRLVVCLYKSDGGTRIKVHQLIANAFMGPCPEGMEICHNDGNHLNNHADNLRYDTRRENILDIIRHGRNKNILKTQCPVGHSLEEGNLRPVQNGHRKCLACNRTKSFLRYNPEYNHKYVSDLSYKYGLPPGNLKKKGLL